MKNGEGVMIYADGEKRRGLWKNDKRVKWLVAMESTFPKGGPPLNSVVMLISNSDYDPKNTSDKNLQLHPLPCA